MTNRSFAHIDPPDPVEALNKHPAPIQRPARQAMVAPVYDGYGSGCSGSRYSVLIQRERPVVSANSHG
jgi:hypothetical protein